MMEIPITWRRLVSRCAFPPSMSTRMAEDLSRCATPIEYSRGNPITFATAVYLDRPDRGLSEAAMRCPESSDEIRSIEYYTIEEAQVPGVWVEWRRGTERRGFDLPKVRFPQLLGGTLSPLHVRAAQTTGGEVSGLDAFRRVVACARGLLAPRFAMTFRRRGFTFAHPRVRVTIDDEVRFYAVPSDPYLGPGALCARKLGAEVASLPHAVLQVRAEGEIPSGLREIVRVLPQVREPEFVFGSRAMLQRADSR